MEYIKVGFSSWPNVGFNNWVSGVETNDGVFECPSDLEKIYGKDNIPSTWEAYYIKSVNDTKVTLKKSDNKIITIDKTKILYNEEVKIEPNTGYELTSAKYFTASNTNGVSINDCTFLMPQEDITKLEITLEASKYTIKYYTDKNQKTKLSLTPANYYYGKGATLSTEISETKDGYTFNGWKNSNGDQVSEISKEDIGDLTFSVVWKANTYSIIYKDGEEELTNFILISTKHH
ncbi:MAG: hypothetical protein MJ211_14435 [Bacteroidales bacterium]|nr:hypothetical protein [Bacteroidales bacterium]